MCRTSQNVGIGQISYRCDKDCSDFHKKSTKLVVIILIILGIHKTGVTF